MAAVVIALSPPVLASEDAAVTAIASLTDPQKLATLRSDRAANDRLFKCVYWLNHARADGKEPAVIIDQAQIISGHTPAHAALVKQGLLRNLDIAGKLGCLTPLNLEKLRRGPARPGGGSVSVVYFRSPCTMALVKVKIRKLPSKHCGVVAILDALGAANFDDAEIDRFLRARRRATELLDEKLDELQGGGKVLKSQVRIFTFNDTVLISMRASGDQPTDGELRAFSLLIRRFFLESLMAGILFRGAIALGEFVADNQTNTILGPAISDAAAWYDKADWIGLHATPKLSLELSRRFERGAGSLSWRDHEVPLRDGTTVKLKACNWRSLLALSSVKKQLHGRSAREWFLGCLSAQRIPAGTEKKYFNTLSFFDACEQNGEG